MGHIRPVEKHQLPLQVPVSAVCPGEQHRVHAEDSGLLSLSSQHIKSYARCAFLELDVRLFAKESRKLLQNLLIGDLLCGAVCQRFVLVGRIIYSHMLAREKSNVSTF